MNPQTHWWLPNEAAGYLAGMIDGEGSVYRGRRNERQIIIYSSERVLLDACMSACEHLSIDGRIYTRERGRNDRPGALPLHRLVVYRRDAVKRAAGVLRLNHPRKQAVLDALKQEG